MRNPKTPLITILNIGKFQNYRSQCNSKCVFADFAPNFEHQRPTQVINANCHPGEYIWSRSHTQADRKCIRGAAAAVAAGSSGSALLSGCPEQSPVAAGYRSSALLSTVALYTSNQRNRAGAAISPSEPRLDPAYSRLINTDYIP